MKRIIVSLLLVLNIVVSGFGQESQNTKNSADQMLRSNGTVNPSTLGLELNIPLGSYPGRGINLPLGLSYSSKLWRFEAKRIWLTPSYTNELPTDGSTWTYAAAVYSEDSASGWTSSIAQPYIEYTGQFIHFNGFGNPRVDEYWTPVPENAPAQLAQHWQVKRITVHLPGGVSYELRDGDAAINVGGGSTIPLNGTYLSVDGSGVRYEENSATGTYRLYMPDGSFYDFRTGTDPNVSHNGEDRGLMRRAEKLTDPHGNFITFDDPPIDPGLAQTFPYGSITDQLGRKFPIMVPRQRPFEPVERSFTLPGMTAPYKLNWQKLEDSFTPEKDHETQFRGSADFWDVQRYHYSPALFDTDDPYNQVSQMSPCTSDKLLILANDYFDGQSGEPNRFNPVVLTSITLPNGAKYKFTYNPYGEVEHIYYPTGGREELLHGPVDSLAQLATPYQLSNRGVTRRDVYESVGDSVADTWTYDADSYPLDYRTIVTAPDLTKTIRFMHRGIPPGIAPNYYCEPHSLGEFPDNYYGLRWGYDNVLAGRPYDERVFSATGQLVQRTRTVWTRSENENNANVNITIIPARYVQFNARVLFTESTTYEGTSGVRAVTKLEYPGLAEVGSALQKGSPLNVIKKSEYAYTVVNDGGINPSATPNGTPSDPTGGTPERITETDYKTNLTYLSLGFLKLPVEVRVTTGAGTVKAKSQIVYDEASYLQPDSASGVPGWNAPEVSGIRGLPTTATMWYDIPNQSFQTHVQYNQFGSPRISWDGNGNLSEVVYTDNFSDGNHNTFAFPTKVKSAPANPSETPFETQTKYRFETGQPVSTKDINNQETTMEYVDPLLRPTKVTAPNGHQTVTQYGQPQTSGIYAGQYLPAQRFVRVLSQIDGSNWKQAYRGFDGLGRITRTQSVDNVGNGDVYVDTEYDNMGRVLRVSNPYCTIANPRCSSTPIWTTNAYDVAGRLSQVAAPDSAPVVTTYGVATTGGQIGTVTTVADQAGKKRRSVTDALGHVTRVDEPNLSNQLGNIDTPNQPTFYEYDKLNNLTKVKQGGSFETPTQTRTFVYDALSRLKSASNPESGTVSYVYDNNGNMTQKTDERGVRTDYLYDGLNRVKHRNYSAPSGLANYQAAPDVTYFYDNLSNAKGKLTKVVTGNLSSPVSTTEYTSFDIMGRVTGAKQTTDGGAVEGYPTSYAYSLSGALIQEIYPSGRVVKNTLDNNGALSMVQSRKLFSSGAGGFWNYASNFEYNAAGAVTSMRLGNGLYEKTVYNNRLQPLEISLGSVWVQVPRLLKLNYTYGDWVNGSIDATKNNGNIITQVITVPTIESNPGFMATQKYYYDSLNRIDDATETVSGTQKWRQDFTYDRYGNRNFIEANTTTIPKTCGTSPNFTVCPADQKIHNPSFDTTKNQFSSGQGWAYDPAGNTKTDANGKTFTYDGDNKQVLVKSSLNVTLGQYYYDGDGKRVKKVVPISGGTETTIFVYDAAGKLIAEYSTNVSAVEQAKVAYLTNDHLGSPRINTNRDGRVISRHDYHPFGEEIVTSHRTSNPEYTPDTVRKQFAGYERDSETDLDYAQARMLSNRLGRFTTTDPIQITPERLTDPQQLNAYVYVRNNPLAYTDPTGMDKEPSDFTTFDKLSTKQQELLKDYWGIKDNKEAAAKWDAFSTNKDTKEMAATFLANTNALARMTLFVGHDAKGPANGVNALDAVKKITSLEKDRFKCDFDKNTIDAWQKEGAHFTLTIGERGEKSISGTMVFNEGGLSAGGSVHEGFDVQAHTGDIPHIQFQYNSESGGGEIDIDYRKGPSHLTFDNSRVIKNFETHVKKFGNPGFSMKELKGKTN